jgi:hypothetical protein
MKLLKNITKNLMPPIILKIYKSMRKKLDKDKEPEMRLFSADSKMFRQIISEAKVYGEYGVGLSTIYSSENKNLVIYSVDSSKDYVQYALDNVNKDNSNIDIDYVDIGPIQENGGGVPLTYNKKNNFKVYREIIWSKPFKIDTVLIDGRFRVACFLTSLLYSEKGTKIIFDDYVTRPKYHIVEMFEEPIKSQGRQSLFIASNDYDKELLKTYIDKFEYVFD